MQIDEISRAIGNIETGIKNLNEKFDALPCPAHTKKIEEFDAYKNKAIGMISLIGLVMGFIGWMISPVIGWIFDKLK